MEYGNDVVAVVAAIDKDLLSQALTTIHRSGFGHVTRVFDPERGDPLVLLARSGTPPPPGFALDHAGQVVILVGAPGRAERAAALLHAQGASRLAAIRRPAAAQPPPGATVPLASPVLDASG